MANNRVSDRKRAANRANAKRSTGPRTEAGKRRVRQNAVKHGLAAQDIIVIAGDYRESEEDFNALQQSLIDYWRPEGPIEIHIVQEILRTMWRQRRA